MRWTVRSPGMVAGCCGVLVLLVGSATAQSTGPAAAPPTGVLQLLRDNCFDCHNDDYAEGELNLTRLPWTLTDRQVLNRWVLIHDRVNQGEMPPEGEGMRPADRSDLTTLLAGPLAAADRKLIDANGRGPRRRLNRAEYEQNLRDLLRLPDLDIRDMLPEDRVSHLFSKTAAVLDMSRVQLAACLDAAEAALRAAAASGPAPPEVQFRRVTGTDLFAETYTYGEREAMFFAKDDQAVEPSGLQAAEGDPGLELALFRSAHWPYCGYPKGFVAERAGRYRVRFSARAVLQQPGYRLTPAGSPIPMTFRARKPSGPDVSGGVRSTGGVMDVLPQPTVFETTIRLKATETFEYSLLGLPVPLARNVDGGPPTYRYPPFPDGGQPGVAFQWLEIEGPLSPADWPPPSHRVLFDDLGPGVTSERPEVDARRLVRRFVRLAAREPLADETVARYESLALSRLASGDTLKDALCAGFQAFLCSGHFLYLREPGGHNDQHAIASRLSHFLTNSRPDARLRRLADDGQLRRSDVLDAGTDRLIRSSEFSRFIENFTADWLSLRRLRRDQPDIRLYPEYRFDDYLIESMKRETQAFVTAMIRDNLPARVLVDADFALVNDRLAEHYGLPRVSGSALQRVSLPEDSPRGGLLTQAAILKVTANGTSTSPVIRGAWVMERLFGEPPPPPPPGITGVDPDIRGARTIRELLDRHTASESCAKCHAAFDPVGLALENFDVLGGWRTHYRGLEHGQPVTGIDRAGHDFAYRLAEPVDASGRLIDGREFDGLPEFRELLIRNDRQLARNLLHQFTVYATGTPVRFSDRIEVDALLDDCAAEGYRVRDLLQALVRSRIFLGKDGCRE